MGKAESYRDLEVWQIGMDLAQRIYEVTQSFPASESYGLTSQMRRAAVSVPSNIAEGFSRRTKRDFAHFLTIAKGSLAEIETQILISKRVGLLAESDESKTLETCDHLSRKLTRFRQRLNESK